MYITMTELEMKQPIVEVYGELFHVHSESDVEVVGDVTIQRTRGRPKHDKQPLEDRPRGRPRHEKPLKEKTTRGRPRQIKEPEKNQQIGRPKK